MWLKCPSLMQSIEPTRPTVYKYWTNLAASTFPSCKGLKTAIILVTWEFWKERNARVYNNKFSMPTLLL